MPTPTESALARLRAADPVARAGLAGTPLGEGLAGPGVRFAAVGGPLEDRWHQALAELGGCIRSFGGPPVLSEGGVYHGTWLESTATISTEVLTRFAPGVARDTLRQLARHQREDGLLPYKVTADGPAFSQIQMVTPLARTIWQHHQLTKDDDGSFLATMYAAMARHDDWLARYRNTRGTGGVEAFCTFDTGHDLSPRFWFAPDRSFRGDTRWCDPDSATLPYVAPDLTANVACQRSYLAMIATALGADPEPWRRKARASTEALFTECFDADDHTFYDRDRSGSPVRVVSDVLLRVLACEVGDEAFFTAALRRYLMHTGKFLSHYGFTSIALDDPRFDADSSRNSWAGPVNFLSLLRAPAAFEQHGHVAELALVSMPVLAALARADRFPQCLDPWTGAAGFTERYSPAILWLLDAVERCCGILPTPDGELYLSGLPPTRLEGGAAPEAVGYARDVDGVHVELVGDDSSVTVYRDARPWLRFPRGWRVVTDRAGVPVRVVGMSPTAVPGSLELLAGAPGSAGPAEPDPQGATVRVELSVAANETVTLEGPTVAARTMIGFVPPQN